MFKSVTRAVIPAGVSASSATISTAPHLVIPMNWFVHTLPLLQWAATFVAILSGAMSALWVGLQFYERLKNKPKG